MDLNCTNFIPRSSDLFDVLTTVDLVFLIICGVLFLINIVIFIDNVIFLWRKHPFGKIPEVASAVVWLVGLCPIVSFICLLSMLIPNAYVFRDFLITVCLSLVMYKFVEFTSAILNHFTSLRDSMSEHGSFVFNKFPACCCVCLPNARVTRKRVLLFKVLVLQYPIISIIITIVAMYTWLDAKYEQGEFEVDNLYPYLLTIRVTSVLTAIYALRVLFHLCKEVLSGVYISQKYTALKLFLMVFNIQHLVFRIMESNGVFPSRDCLTGRRIGDFYENIAYSIEIFFISLLNLWAYRRPLAELDFPEENKISESPSKEVSSPEHSANDIAAINNSNSTLTTELGAVEGVFP